MIRDIADYLHDVIEAISKGTGFVEGMSYDALIKATDKACLV